MTTQAIEDYLKAIYDLEAPEARVPTNALAARICVSPASVTGMVKKLAEMNLVSHEPYQGVALTESGRRIALEVLRHHRLVELYLFQAMGVPWHKVHEEAERWEHVLSEDMEDRIDELLGHPSYDPHGAPIPTRDGHLPATSDVKLSTLEVGQTGTIAQVQDRNAEMLQYLGDRGMFPGVALSVLSQEPFNGPLTVRVAESDVVIGREVADCITVHVDAPAPEAAR